MSDFNIPIALVDSLPKETTVQASVNNRNEGDETMKKIFNVKERQDAFDYILSTARECSKIVSLVQIGSGAIGYHDEYSDLDFVIALDSGDSMQEVMEYMRKKISEKYDLVYFTQEETRHLQVFLFSNFLEIDIGYGGYEHAAALKPAFKVLYDKSGVVEEKMIQSREWMDNKIFGEKQKEDIGLCNSVWVSLMHAAVAIHRGNYFRAIGELEYIRKLYIDLLGDRYRLESKHNREIDRLPENEKAAIMSTFVTGQSSNELWESLVRLTDLLYKEMEEFHIPVTHEMLNEYYANLR